MKIFRGDASYVSGGYLFDSGAEALEVIRGVAVEGVGHLFAQYFCGGVEIEDEGIEDGILGAMDFLVGERIFREAVNIFEQCLDSFDRGGTFRAHHNADQSVVVERCAHAATDSVCQATLRADISEEARGETTPEGLIEDGDGVVVGVVALGAELDHVDIALVDVFLVDQEIAGLGRLEIDLRCGYGWAFGPVLECLAQLRLEGGRIEVADDAE